MTVSNLVFTGAATDSTGEPITRADLENACRKAGITVRKEFPAGTPYALVASRMDTVKAKKALAIGVTVLPYSELLATLKALNVPVTKTGTPADPWVDAKPSKMQVQPAHPDDTAEYGGDL